MTVTVSGSSTIQETNSPDNVTENAYMKAAPEHGDEYFEAQASDGRWVSYVNPRDEYRNPYLGNGSGKICTILLNQAGDPIVGETVPNTTITIRTGNSVEWHSSADPITVKYPLTEWYERPLDSDQFGTADDLPQGDGYMDSHCIEFHGLTVGDEIEYGNAEVDGAHADQIEVIGYIEQGNQTWDSDIDPIEMAVPYEETGGGWTYSEGSTHGQTVVVLQLSTDGSTEKTNESEQGVNNKTDDVDLNDSIGNNEEGEYDTNTDQETLPGIITTGAFAVVLSLAVVIVLKHR